MEPRHHIHISTGFLFVLGLLILAIVGLILWAKAHGRKQDREHEAYLARLKARETEATAQRRKSYYSYDRTSPARSFTTPSAGYPSQPQQPAPVVVNNGNDGMLTGFILGDLMGSSSRPSETVVYENTPAPAPDSGGSASSGSSSDGGGMSYDSGSSSSDSGSSGGFDVSW